MTTKDIVVFEPTKFFVNDYRNTLVVDTISHLVEKKNLFANTHSLSYKNQVCDNSFVVVTIST